MPGYRKIESRLPCQPGALAVSSIQRSNETAQSTRQAPQLEMDDRLPPQRDCHPRFGLPSEDRREAGAQADLKRAVAVPKRSDYQLGPGGKRSARGSGRHERRKRGSARTVSTVTTSSGLFRTQQNSVAEVSSHAA